MKKVGSANICYVGVTENKNIINNCEKRMDRYGIYNGLKKDKYVMMQGIIIVWEIIQNNVK